MNASLEPTGKTTAEPVVPYPCEVGKDDVDHGAPCRRRRGVCRRGQYGASGRPLRRCPDVATGAAFLACRSHHARPLAAVLAFSTRCTVQGRMSGACPGTFKAPQFTTHIIEWASG